MRGMRATVAFPVLLVCVASCSSQDRNRAPTEEQIHAGDRSLNARHVGTHQFRCRDGGSLLVDFRNGGMSLEIRSAPASPPLVLTAPSQGAAYVGNDARAIMREQELDLLLSDGSRRLCQRRSLG